MALTPITQAPNFGTYRVTPPTPFPATIAAGGSWVSDLMPAGLGAVMAACTSSQVGALSIQRYADLAGLVPVGTAPSQVLTANTPAWVGSSDSLPYLSFAVTITNTSGSVANISNCSILTGPIGPV